MEEGFAKLHCFCVFSMLWLVVNEVSGSALLISNPISTDCEADDQAGAFAVR